MAAKKAKAKPGKDFLGKPVVVQIRGGPDYEAAIREFAQSQGLTIAALADQALRAYAVQRGFPKPIPTR